MYSLPTALRFAARGSWLIGAAENPGSFGKKTRPDEFASGFDPQSGIKINWLAQLLLV